MKRTLNLFILIALLAIGSCFNPPEFSEIPQIVRIEGVRTFEVPGANTPDSMIVSVQFRDGNGDIGIDATQNEPPYNERWFFLKTPITKCETGLTSPCNRISYVQDPTKLSAYVTYSMKRTTPGYDTLPAFVQPFDCSRYYVVTTGSQVRDTLYSVTNRRYSNFFMDIYIKSGNSYDKFNFNSRPYPACEIYGLDGRLPILAKDGDLSAELPLDGTITYKVASASFYSLLRNRTVQLRIRIMDRAGNMSDEAISNDFTLR
jgi:hypothetical protein